MEGNPVMLLDPNGLSASPVFDLEGNHIGNTSEGYSGEILIYSGSDDVDFSQMTASDAEAMDDVSTLNNDVANNTVSDDAFSKIMTDVAENADGTKILRNVNFEFDQVGGKIKTGDDPGSTFYYKDDEIFAVKTTDMDFTVENVQTAILAHEYYGHHVTQKSDAKHNHRYAYMFEMQYIHRNNVNVTPRYYQQTINLLIQQISIDHPKTNVSNEFNRLKRTWEGRP